MSWLRGWCVDNNNNNTWKAVAVVGIGCYNSSNNVRNAQISTTLHFARYLTRRNLQVMPAANCNAYQSGAEKAKWQACGMQQIRTRPGMRCNIDVVTCNARVCVCVRVVVACARDHKPRSACAPLNCVMDALWQQQQQWQLAAATTCNIFSQFSTLVDKTVNKIATKLCMTPNEASKLCIQTHVACDARTHARNPLFANIHFHASVCVNKSHMCVCKCKWQARRCNGSCNAWQTLRHTVEAVRYTSSSCDEFTDCRYERLPPLNALCCPATASRSRTPAWMACLSVRLQLNSDNSPQTANRMS